GESCCGYLSERDRSQARSGHWSVDRRLLAGRDDRRDLLGGEPHLPATRESGDRNEAPFHPGPHRLEGNAEVLGEFSLVEQPVHHAALSNSSSTVRSIRVDMSSARSSEHDFRPAMMCASAVRSMPSSRACWLRVFAPSCAIRASNTSVLSRTRAVARAPRDRASDVATMPQL